MLYRIYPQRLEVPSWAISQDAQEEASPTELNSAFNRKHSLQGQTISKSLFMQDGGKEERNVKRRIYDALNVMIAAGLLEKEDTEIKIKEQ